VIFDSDWNPQVRSEVDALGVITISRGCFERCCSKKTTPPDHSNLHSVPLRNRRPTLLRAPACRTPSEASPRRRCGHASRFLWKKSNTELEHTHLTYTYTHICILIYITLRPQTPSSFSTLTGTRRRAKIQQTLHWSTHIVHIYTCIYIYTYTYIYKYIYLSIYTVVIFDSDWNPQVCKETDDIRLEHTHLIYIFTYIYFLIYITLRPQTPLSFSTLTGTRRCVHIAYLYPSLSPSLYIYIRTYMYIYILIYLQIYITLRPQTPS